MGRISCIRSSCHMLIKSDFLRFGLQTLVTVTPHNAKPTTWSRRNRHFCTSATTTNLTTTTNLGDLSKDLAKEGVDVEVRYMRGLPQVTVPLPSRNEKCQFTLRPVTHNVGDFLEMLKAEDRGIDRATILTDTGVRIASGCSIENLLGENFWLLLNDKKYFVVPPKREKFTSEEVSTLGDVRALVSQLYETLHIGEHQIIKERELNAKLETLNQQLGPLEEKKFELDVKATRKTTILTWFGLGLMSAQFGVLARLTWWEYSWDIMEPVTYFVTYGTAIACYAYFVLTKQEYVLPDVKERQHLLTLHKAAQKIGLNLDEYNQIKRQIAEIEYDLRRLRDPLCMHLPAPPPKTPSYSATEIMRSKKLSTDQLQSVLATAAAATTTDPATKSELLKLGKIIETATKRLKK